MPNGEKEIGLIGGVEKRRLELVDYDPVWPGVFQTHSAAIVTALGKTVLRLEHIGSTSVPGLAAKPIVDILVVVPDASDEDAYLPQMETAGYELRVREPDFHEHRMFRTRSKDVHIHIYGPDSPEIMRHLTFRDRLRKHAGDRQLYEDTKRKLLTQEWADMDAYADAKTEVIEAIIAAALQAGEISR
jgi:GrpB-like predicted nucleotidyltransferase (UPF0157 family)